LLKPLTALQYIVHNTIVYSAWRWLTKPKHVTDDISLIKLCLDLFLYSFINKHPTIDTIHSEMQQYHATNNNKTEDICIES